MYNINYYQNSHTYYSDYKQQQYKTEYNYNIPNPATNHVYYHANNKPNRVIKLIPTINNQYTNYSNYSNYNYVPKTPSQSPIKNSLINNNYKKINIISKSPEPYIRLYKQNVNSNRHITNVNVNINQNNYPLNIRINNIQRVNKDIKTNNYQILQPKIYISKTPEPNLRGRNKLKQKKVRIKLNNYNGKTFIPLNTNIIQTNNNYNTNLVNKTKYLNTPNYNINSNYNYTPNYNSNYNYINSINKNLQYTNYLNIPNTQKLQNNNIITNYSRVNYYSANNNYNQFNQKISNTNNINIINNHQNNNNYYLVKKNFKSFDLNVRHHHHLHPKSNFNSAEFIIVNSIGEGSFGKIYCVQWIKNNKLYAMKKLDIQSLEELNEFKSKVKIVDNLYKKTKHYGFIKIYADKVVPLYNQSFYYNYYIIMELGERDWEKEIQLRLVHQRYYSEYELYQIIYQLVKTLSLMQQNNVSHRDIKPANVLIMKGLYKICDFGEATIINGNGVVVQNVRGSQLYMSPILFYAYNHNVSQVMHNTYKSDVYSFGMCVLLAATLSGYTLYDIREILNIQQVTKIIVNKLSNRYSINFINLLLKMLQIDENLRMDFIQLEHYITNFWK